MRRDAGTPVTTGTDDTSIPPAISFPSSSSSAILFLGGAPGGGDRRLPLGPLARGPLRAPRRRARDPAPLRGARDRARAAPRGAARAPRARRGAHAPGRRALRVGRRRHPRPAARRAGPGAADGRGPGIAARTSSTRASRSASSTRSRRSIAHLLHDRALARAERERAGSARDGAPPDRRGRARHPARALGAAAPRGLRGGAGRGRRRRRARASPREAFDLVLTDLALGEGPSGMDVLRAASASSPRRRS